MCRNLIMRGERHMQVFNIYYSYTHTHTHVGHLLAAVGLVSSSQSRSSCLLDNDHTCVQVCGEAHMGVGGVSVVSDTQTFTALHRHIFPQLSDE